MKYVVKSPIKYNRRRYLIGEDLDWEGPPPDPGLIPGVLEPISPPAPAPEPPVPAELLQLEPLPEPVPPAAVMTVSLPPPRPAPKAPAAPKIKTKKR